MKETMINHQPYFFYIQVIFSDSPKLYYYLSLDTSIKIGDYVAVEVDEKICEAKVVKTGFYQEENAPYPVNATKLIISKINKSSTNQVNINQDSSIQFNYESKIFQNSELEKLIRPYCEIDNGVLKGIKACHFTTIVIPSDVTEIKNLTKYELGLEGIEGILPGYYNPCKMKKLIIPATVKIANINLWKEYSYIPNELEELYISDGVEEVTCDLYGAPLKQIFIPKSIKRLHFDQWNFDMIYLDENNPNMFFKDGYLFVQSDDPKSDYKYDIVWHHPQASDEINIDYNVKIKTDGFKKVKNQEGVEKVFFSSCDKVIDYLSIPASIKDINTKQNPYDKDHALWIKQIELSPNNKDYQIDNNYLVKKPKPLNPNNYYYIDNSEPNIIAYTPKIDYTTSLFSPIPADYFTVLFFNHVTINYNFIINWEATNRSKYYVERKRPSHPDGSGGYFQELDKEKWSELCKILANKYIEYKLQSDNEFNKLNQSDLLKLILKNISSLYVGKNVTTIKKGYFDYNPKLVKVVFANKSSLKYLDSNAFLGTPWFEEKKQE